MAQRQIRGVMTGVFDQVEPGHLSVRTLDHPMIGGRATIGGVAVTPFQPPDDGLPPGDPLIMGVARTAGIDLDPVTPMYTETREAAQQDVVRFPAWLVAVAAGIALLG